ncbi:MAG: thiamine diphosphokinase [Calditrichaeota bacterium]|nr:MAG: thiamine diphosphokinase [Calditrichota bacterium]
MKRNFILFLNGTYKDEDIDFYKSIIGSKTTVAVDGGYAFFDKAGIIPKYIIGDGDSLDKVPEDIQEETAVFEFPVEKDLTDGHIALDFCMKEDFETIIVVMPEIGEPDHFLGNILLLFNKEVKQKLREKRDISIITRHHEYRIIDNGKLELYDRAGETLSIMPISKSIMLNCEGTKYDAKGIKVDLGETRALRNKIVTNEALIKVSGEAICISSFKDEHLKV